MFIDSSHIKITNAFGFEGLKSFIVFIFIMDNLTSDRISFTCEKQTKQLH